MKKDKSCKTPRWRMLKSQLNNLSAKEFSVATRQLKDAVLVDVRTVEEFQIGHLPSAINIDYLSEDFWEKIEKLNQQKNYFIYCRSGRRSIRVCTLMRNGGFDNDKIFNLDKGFVEWVENYPNAIVRL